MFNYIRFSILYVSCKRPFVYIPHNRITLKLQSPLQPVKTILIIMRKNLNQVVVWAGKELLIRNSDIYDSEFGCLKRWDFDLQEDLHKPEN